MSSVVTKPAASAHRAQIVAEAVESAYIREIAAAPRRQVRARSDCIESPRTIARPALGEHARTRALVARRRPALGLRRSSIGSARGQVAS
jgi:hypothetical protein